MWVLTEMDALASEGWALLHVSVDHGLYKGVDSRLEGGPVALRYTFGRNSLQKTP